MKGFPLIKPYISLFNDYLQEQDFTGQPDSLYEPLRYILHSGGKRLRPALCLLGYHVFREHFENALPQALALELFHNFSLVHDDIMDNAPIRRGNVTVHEKWSENQAILSGDLILLVGYKFLLMNLEPSAAIAVVGIFNKMAITVCEGQQLDADFEKEEMVSRDAYIEMIRKKTAVLLGASAQIGALCGGAESEEARQLGSFFEKIGIAFQIQDDLLDVYADEKFGKKRGGDIIRGKKTILQVLLHEAISSEEWDELQSFREKEVEELVANTIKGYEDTGVREATEEIRDKYFKDGLKNLQETHADSGMVERLIEFARSLVYRDH
jgi:geranylgeranyl diphosphate synthase type II